MLDGIELFLCNVAQNIESLYQYKRSGFLFLNLLWFVVILEGNLLFVVSYGLFGRVFSEIDLYCL